MCYNPIVLKMPDGTHKQVPCGKCLECLKKYQAEWSNRMAEELKRVNGKAVFFTLTYDENNVPKNYLYDYQIFRSPTDYGYDNTFTDKKGNKRVQPCFRGQHKHLPVDPCVELREAGVDTSRIIDFNLHRDNHDKFIEQIQKIYGDYIRNFDTCRIYDSDTTDDNRHFCSIGYDFDTYEGDFFSDTTADEEGDRLDPDLFADAFTELLNDDEYEERPTDYVEYGEKYSPNSCLPRERPIMSFNSVRKQDVQAWIKRARQQFARWSKKLNWETTPEFTYWITAEYGPRTLRPHYHGILFGVNAEQARFMANDWKRHHGNVKFENLRSEGSMVYVSKYCSKGFFEHPLCAKDFFYRQKGLDKYGNTKISEYHSKHYERCVEIFGIDEPIVDPPFHLVSKGMGISYVTDERIEYFTGEFKDIFEFAKTDSTPTISVAYTPDVPLPWEPEYDEFIDKYGKEKYEEMFYDLTMTSNIEKEKDKIIKCKTNNYGTKDYEEAIERLYDRFKYQRYNPVKKTTTTYSMPKYYRTKILSDALRIALAAYVQEEHVRVYQEKFEQVRAANPDREDFEVVLMLEQQERKDNADRYADCRRQVTKYLDKSQI